MLYHLGDSWLAVVVVVAVVDHLLGRHAKSLALGKLPVLNKIVQDGHQVEEHSTFPNNG